MQTVAKEAGIWSLSFFLRALVADAGLTQLQAYFYSELADKTIGVKDEGPEGLP